MARKLTPKQERFCEEYLKDLNATAAARRAGYKDPNIGRQLITKNNVADRIGVLKDQRSERTKITGDMVVAELAKLGFSDMKRISSWSRTGVDLIPSEELSDDDSAAVSQIQSTTTVTRDRYGNETETENVTVKLHSKLGALNALGKHFGIFDETTDTGKLADTFLAGADAMRKLEVEDLSEA